MWSLSSFSQLDDGSARLRVGPHAPLTLRVWASGKYRRALLRPIYSTVLMDWIKNVGMGGDLERKVEILKKYRVSKKREGLGGSRQWSAPRMEVVYGGLWLPVGE